MTNIFVDPSCVSATLSGSVVFTNGSSTITGVGTSFTTELASGDWIAPTISPREWYRVSSITDDTLAVLEYAYAQSSNTIEAYKNDYSGTTPSEAVPHINEATTYQVRAPGDIIYLRRGQTYLYEATDIVFDEDGDPNNYITLMGDDGTGWSGETGLARPIIDFGGTTKRAILSGDYFWYSKDLDFRNNTHSYGLVTNVTKCKFRNCRFREGDGLYSSGLMYIYSTEFYDCQFEDNQSPCVIRPWDGGSAKFCNCSFDGNADVFSFGNGSGVYIEIYDCSFGTTTQNTGWNFNFANASGVRVIARNLETNDSNFIRGLSKGSYLRIEDYNGILLDNRAWYYPGTIRRNTSIVRTGGADSSAEVEPNSNCGSEQPLEMINFKLWCPAQEKTISVYMRADGWSTLPTASECYIEATYYANTVDASRATVQSGEAFSTVGVWTQFSVTINPATVGPVYVTGYLKKYEADSTIYVDIKPVIS